MLLKIIPVTSNLAKNPNKLLNRQGVIYPPPALIPCSFSHPNKYMKRQWLLESCYRAHVVEVFDYAADGFLLRQAGGSTTARSPSRFRGLGNLGGGGGPPADPGLGGRAVSRGGWWASRCLFLRILWRLLLRTPSSVEAGFLVLGGGELFVCPDGGCDSVLDSGVYVCDSLLGGGVYVCVGVVGRSV